MSQAKRGRGRPKGPATNDTQIVVRVPQSLVDRIKAYGDQLSKAVGVPVSTAAATRKLIEAGIESANAMAKP